MRTRLFVVMMAVAALCGAQDASAKIRGAAGVMQDALTGSVRKAVTVAVTKPVTSPLLEWARVAAEKARQEQKNWKMQQQNAAEVNAPDPEFTRDRD